MNIENIQAICKKFKGVTEDIKWDDHLCFNVGGKMFLVTAPDAVPVSASIKVTDENFQEMSSRPGMMPAPYLARHKWVHIDNIQRVSAKEWKQLIEQAYRAVAAKLPARTRKQLGLA